jgi:hypothetical protein
MFRFGDKVKIISKEKYEMCTSVPYEKYKFVNMTGKIIDFQERWKNRKIHIVYVIAISKKTGREYKSKIDNNIYNSTGLIWYDDELILYNKNRRIL